MTHSPYSQYQQDAIILDLLLGKRGGVFVDVGASDGISISNTYLLEKEYGWTGICVEPVSSTFTKLVQNRKAVCINCCAGSYQQSGLVPFQEHPHTDASRIWSGSPVYKGCAPLNDILKVVGLSEIDYLSIDTEGNEWEIIKDIDFSRHSIRFIDFEHNEHLGEMEKAKKAMIAEFLTFHGYHKLMDVGVDSIHVKAFL